MYRNQRARKRLCHSYVGLLSTFDKWVPDLSLNEKLIKDLGKNNTVFKWTENHQLCFKEVKEAIANSSPLEPFEPTADSLIFTDALTN